MNTMERRSQVGQSLIIGFEGTDVDEAAGRIRRFRPAGVVLVPRNIRSAAQVLDLTVGLQTVARESGMPPLLIAIDQEGGDIVRLTGAHGFTPLPSAMAVGELGDAAAARDLASVAAQELAAVGVNFSLAPVLDLALDPANTVIGARSYGADPALVTRLGRAVIEGLQRAGVLACAKHFPGHGATDIDSHLDLPRLRSTLAELEGRDLVPFSAAVDADCAGIMTAHVLSAFDPSVPATLSRRTVEGTLRGALGYRGLILSDALEMRALDRVAIPRSQRALEALRAGVDLLIFEGDLELIDASVATIETALDDGELEPERLDASAQRLAVARARIGPAPRASDLRRIGTATHRALAEHVVLGGVATEGNGLLPLDRPPHVLDIAAGGDLARAMSWPLLVDPSEEPTTPIVVAIEDTDPSADVAAAVSALRSRAIPVIAIVLTGWGPLQGMEADAVVWLLDLPRELWPTAGRAILDGESQRATGGAR